MKTTNAKLVLFLMLLSITQLFSQGESKPNVIIIMTDDMGYGDMGYHGNPDINTPTLNTLAKESVEFSNFYVSPVCAPTRASLMTGRYNIRTGVFDTYSGGAIMASNETTMAEVFRDNGYATGIFGKWHLGDSYPSRPQDQGFTTSIWHLSGGIGQVGDVFNYYEHDRSYFDPVLFKNGEKFQSKGYCSDVYTDEAISFIKEQGDTPFFTYLSFNAPHTPLQVPESYYNKYKNKSIDPDKFRDKGAYTHDMSEGDINAAKKVYAMVENIDDNIARLINSLKEQNLYDNTIIVFLTDNGPQQNRYTGGFRGRKGQVREGGIHVPFYIKLPKSNLKKKKIKTPTAHIDVLPTLAELCTIKLQSTLELDGQSLAKTILNNEAIGKRPLFFEWQRSYPEKYRNMSVIYNNYKLIGNSEDTNDLGKFELYHLEKDPFEAINISKENTRIVSELKSKLDDWYNDIMKSENILNSPRIIVGSDKEKHTILNRNDARGMQLIWDDDRMHVRWDLNVIEAGNYDIICHFRKPIPDTGDMVIRMGVQNFTKKITEKNVQTIKYDDVRLNKGTYALDGWYWSRWQVHYTPFYIELIKTN